MQLALSDPPFMHFYSHCFYQNSWIYLTVFLFFVSFSFLSFLFTQTRLFFFFYKPFYGFTSVCSALHQSWCHTDIHKYIDPNHHISMVPQKLHISKFFQELRIKDFAIKYPRIFISCCTFLLPLSVSYLEKMCLLSETKNKLWYEKRKYSNRRDMTFYSQSCPAMDKSLFSYFQNTWGATYINNLKSRYISQFIKRMLLMFICTVNTHLTVSSLLYSSGSCSNPDF